MKITKRIIALLFISALFLCSCSRNEASKNPGTGSEQGASEEYVEFKNDDFRNIIASALGKDGDKITETDLTQIIGLSVYNYAERIENTMQSKDMWSITVKKDGFNEVSEKYYATPKEEREGLESPADYSFNIQLEKFEGYEDIKLLTNLTELSLESEYNLIQEDPVRYFSNLEKLEKLSLYNYVVPDLEEIGRFTELHNLNISINLRAIPDGVEIEYIEDLTPLKNLTKLESLSLSGNYISDLSPLTSLDSITDLSITYAALGDISPVAQMQNLKTVTFYYNGISDVTPLTMIPGLENIHLDYNYIEDLSPFAKLDPEVVKFVSVDMNSFDDDTPLKHLGKDKVNLGYEPYWDEE